MILGQLAGLVSPQDDIEYIASILWPLARTIIIRLRRNTTLSLKDAPVHGLVDTGTRGCNSCRPHWCCSLNGLRINSHWRVLSTDGKIAGGIFEARIRSYLGLVSFRGIERCLVVARLDYRGVLGGASDIAMVRKGQVAMNHNGDKDKREKSNAAEKISKQETRPAGHTSPAALSLLSQRGTQCIEFVLRHWTNQWRVTARFNAGGEG